MTLEITNLTEYSISVGIMTEIAASLSQRDIELIISDDNYIQKINKEYRGINHATDVLSFPLEGTEAEKCPIPLGSIIISVDQAKHAAKRYQHTLEQEIILLFIHGLLHLIGYDHEKDHGEMRTEEAMLIHTYKLPKSLILRMENA